MSRQETHIAHWKGLEDRHYIHIYSDDEALVKLILKTTEDYLEDQVNVKKVES